MISPQLDRMDGLTTIVGHDKYGFNVSGVFMRGSVLVFPRYTLLWNVAKAVDVSPRSMAPFHMMNPKPELVIVGTGLGAYSNINPACYAYLSRKGISLEVMNIVSGAGPPLFFYCIYWAVFFFFFAGGLFDHLSLSFHISSPTSPTPTDKRDIHI